MNTFKSAWEDAEIDVMWLNARIVKHTLGFHWERLALESSDEKPPSLAQGTIPVFPADSLVLRRERLSGAQ